ncbi:MFS transporter [Confluentibacter flavum]|uniref:Tetracycline resistance MFS efflux pump n=1 Tax=Confluentibacter flavum TaxID=1909700 RepID=A0A2N3HHV0_9FLAO|nr:MFS transporter [Confluentibacter flavum]PKQ44536.1 tetracycline resistance MFS efflux pump [Confluentibacter flavum]
MINEKSSSQTKFLAVIFLAVFLDLLGVTIIIPVIPALFEGEHAMFSGFQVGTRSLLYGLLIGCYSIMQFIGAPVLGALSDRYGRKPILSIALTGAFIGYTLFGYAILENIIWLLFLARMVPGFMGGNIAVIYSAIADISSEKEKIKNFGLVGSAFGLGFIIGPGLGGVLADKSVVSWFNYATPFWFTAILTLINIILIRFFFPETLKVRTNKKISILQGVNNLKKIAFLSNLKNVFAIVFLVTLGFTFFTQFYSVHLFRKYGYSVKDIGTLFLWTGIFLVIAQSFIVRIISKMYLPKQVLKWSLLFLSLFLVLLIFCDETWKIYLMNALIALAFGISSPNLTGLVSNNAEPNQQGEVLGLNQSITSLAQVLPPLIGGLLLGLDSVYPILTGGLVCFVAVILFWLRRAL